MSRAVYRTKDNEKLVEVVDLQVVGPDSKTVEFELSDGAKFVVRFTARRIWRAIKEYNTLGEPVYGMEAPPPDFSVRNIPSEYCISPETVAIKKGGKVEGYA